MTDERLPERILSVHIKSRRNLARYLDRYLDRYLVTTNGRTQVSSHFLNEQGVTRRCVLYEADLDSYHAEPS